MYAAGWLSEIGGRLTGRTPMLTREKALELLEPYWMCSSERIQDELGYRPEIALPAGLRETMKWYKKEGWL